ncbi:hypothetical protein H5410_028349 [Solanum commersonii]|uniref:Uncharacterized protein n=1 Tax=Solanum commersonii TaxID=4109 RepID=A0A9J5Z1U5_SOLCO|nr:hypothetical protein H5410_028349 [Solanum commersonii]
MELSSPMELMSNETLISSNLHLKVPTSITLSLVSGCHSLEVSPALYFSDFCRAIKNGRDHPQGLAQVAKGGGFVA